MVEYLNAIRSVHFIDLNMHKTFTNLAVGIINNYFDAGKNGTSYISLLGVNYDILIAIGDRLNRALKINIGNALYFRNDVFPQKLSK